MERKGKEGNARSCCGVVRSVLFSWQAQVCALVAAFLLAGAAFGNVWGRCRGVCFGCGFGLVRAVSGCSPLVCCVEVVWGADFESCGSRFHGTVRTAARKFKRTGKKAEKRKGRKGKEGKKERSTLAQVGVCDSTAGAVL